MTPQSRAIAFTVCGLLILAVVVSRFAPRKAEVFRQTPIVITSEVLYKEFKNEKAANDKYSGKLIEVSGTVDRLDMDTVGQPFAILKGGDALGDIRCVLAAKNRGQAGRIHPGQPATLRGVCLGKVMNIFVDECSLKS